jgi:RHS repeat-associated protein
VVLGPSNQLASANGAFFRYDDRQHIAHRRSVDGQQIHYRYDALDRLVGIDDGGGSPWTAAYDGLGRRLSAGRGDRLTSFYWDGDRLAGEVAPDRRLRLYLYPSPDSLVPSLLVDYPDLQAEPDRGQVYALFTNQQGVPDRVDDAGGRTVWWADHIEPYGLVEVAPGNLIELALRWPGHYFDRDTGLHYNRFRYYDPVLGRYLQTDPWGLGGGINVYGYAPNPVSTVDLLGLHEVEKGQPNAPKKGGPDDVGEHPPSAKPAGDPAGPPSKAWNDPNLTPDEFIRDWRARYSGSRLSDADLRAHFDAGRRLNPDTGHLRVPHYEPPPGFQRTEPLPAPGTPAHEQWQNWERGNPNTIPCFPGQTVVKTPRGDVAIEALSEGDRVYAHDLALGLVTSVVTAVHRNWAAELVSLVTSAGSLPGYRPASCGPECASGCSPVSWPWCRSARRWRPGKPPSTSPSPSSTPISSPGRERWSTMQIPPNRRMAAASPARPASTGSSICAPTRWSTSARPTRH